jgi:hypothetical protein
MVLEIELVPETLVFNRTLMRLIAREEFIARRDNNVKKEIYKKLCVDNIIYKTGVT